MGILFLHPCTREATWRADYIWERPLEDMQAWEELAETVCTTGQLGWELAGRQSGRMGQKLDVPQTAVFIFHHPTPCVGLYRLHVRTRVHTHTRPTCIPIHIY